MAWSPPMLLSPQQLASACSMISSSPLLSSMDSVSLLVRLLGSASSPSSLCTTMHATMPGSSVGLSEETGKLGFYKVLEMRILTYSAAT